METERKKFKPEPNFGPAQPYQYLGMADPTRPLDAGMPNVIADRLGTIARCAGHPDRTDVGDGIDRGLILRRMLDEAGFILTVKPKPKNDGN